MTIAIEVKLVEDWNNNLPCVVVKRKTLRHGEQVAAILTPEQPKALVTITSANDLILEPGNLATLDRLR